MKSKAVNAFLILGLVSGIMGILVFLLSKVWGFGLYGIAVTGYSIKEFIQMRKEAKNRKYIKD